MNSDQLVERLKAWQLKNLKASYEIAEAAAAGWIIPPFFTENNITPPEPVRQEAHNPGPGGSIPSPATLRIVISTPRQNGVTNRFYELTRKSKMPRVSSFIEAVYRELIVVTSGSTSSLSQLRVITETAAHTAYLNNNQIKELIEALQAILPSQPEKQEAKKNSEEVYLAALNILANRLVGERDFSTNEPDLDNCIETQKVAQKALVANAISYAQHYIEQRNEQTARACAATVDSSDSNPAGEVDQVLRAQHTATRGR